MLRWAVPARQTSVRVVLLALEAIRRREGVGVLTGTTRTTILVLAFQQLLHGERKRDPFRFTPVACSMLSVSLERVWENGLSLFHNTAVPDNGAEKRAFSARLHGAVDELACLDSIEALHAPYRTECPAGAAGALVLRWSDAARRLLAGLWAGPVDLGVRGWWVVMP